MTDEYVVAEIKEAAEFHRSLLMAQAKEFDWDDQIIFCAGTALTLAAACFAVQIVNSNDPHLARQETFAMLNTFLDATLRQLVEQNIATYEATGLDRQSDSFQA